MSFAAAFNPVAAPGAVCPVHPERASVGTCARCGRFVCSACEGDRGTCPACVSKALLAIPSSATLATVASVFIGGRAAIELSYMLVSISAIASPGASMIRDLVEGLLGFGILITLIGGAIAFLMWLHRGVRQAQALGYDIGMSPGMAVAWWFVPFANLVKPYYAVRTLTSVVGGEELVARGRLSLWWGLWIVGNVLANIETRITFSEGFDGATPTAAYVVGFGASAAAAGAAFLCVRLTRNLQNVFDERRRASAP